MTKYVAYARRWQQGWELHVEGVGVTQVRLLQDAAQQVRDLVETMHEQLPDINDVEIVLELGELGDEVKEARQLTADALELQGRAAALNRSVVSRLREAELSVTDIATVLGVSRGRVSQLLTNT